MTNIEGEKSIPVGLPSELEKRKEALPVQEVENKVLFVNPEFNLPINLKEGDSAKLGLFLGLSAEEKFL